MNHKKYIPYIDIHTHYENLNYNKINKDLKENNIIAITNNLDIDSYNKLQKLKNIKNLYFAYGLYPDNVLKKSLEDCYKDLDKIDFKKSIGIGEIGIDYKITKNKEKREEQIKLFEKQLEIAQKLKKPVIVHSRYAEKPVLKSLEKYDLTVILHWFNGNKKEQKKALEKGYILTERFGHLDIENINDYLNQIFIETDYPVPYKLKNTDINSIIESYKIFSEKHNLELDFVKEKMYNNFKKIFKVDNL